MDAVFGFVHVAARGQWKESAARIGELLCASGLYQRTERLFVSAAGPECGCCVAQDAKTQVIHQSPDASESELLTLRLVQEFCRSRTCQVYYLNTDRRLERFLIDRHADCSRALESNDICGVGWQQSPRAGFPTNQWWARSDYVAALLPPEAPPDGARADDSAQRIDCESWIGSGRGARVASFHPPGDDPSPAQDAERPEPADADPADHVFMGDSLIGDALLGEPALRALARVRGRPVRLVLRGPAAALFEHHPGVMLVDPGSDEAARIEAAGIPLSPVPAARFAIRHGRHISEGYFPQLGLSPHGHDHKPRLYGDRLGPEFRPARGSRNGRIALCPFSASCAVHKTGVPNKTIAAAWWNGLIPKLPLPADSFGASHEPPLEGCGNCRGLPLRTVAGMLQQYELLITGDTGLSHMAAALDCDILALVSSDVPVWLTGPLTKGSLEVIDSPVPPRWTHEAVLASLRRMLPA